MAASRGRTLAVLVTLRALEPVLGYTFFSALLSLFFRTDTRKKNLFLAGFFFIACASVTLIFTVFRIVSFHFILSLFFRTGTR